MNTKKVINELKRKYPGSKVIKLPEKNPTEILCEIDPTEGHTDFSVAISIIDRSLPHYHNLSVETYEVIKGTLTVIKDGKDFVVRKGERLTILPKEIHFAIGNETWIKVNSNPGWTPGDHILSINTDKLP